MGSREELLEVRVVGAVFVFACKGESADAFGFCRPISI